MSMRKRSYRYLAAAMDGDGGIYICKSKVNGCDSYQAQLCVANSDLRLMKWLKHHFGGCLHKNSEKGSTPNFGSIIKKSYQNRDDNWQWRLTGNKAVGFVLDQVQPYLLINSQKYEPVKALTDLHAKYRASAQREECFIRYSNVTDDFDPETPPTIEYFAGMLDMEGSVSIVKAARPENYRVHLRIANNNKALVDWLKKNFSGAVYTTKKLQEGKKRYTWYRKETDEKSVERFLLAILPYLIVKRETAQLALNMIRMPKEQRTLEIVNKIRDRVVELNYSFSSQEANTPACPENGQKIESQLDGDAESALLVTVVA
jgi:hypothetical protein